MICQEYKDDCLEQRKDIFDKIFFESENCKLARRKVSETLRRIKGLLNSVSGAERIPPNYRAIDEYIQEQKNNAYWKKY